MIKNITNLGDSALYCDFGQEVSIEINKKVISYFNTIRKLKIDGVTNLAPSYNKLIISYDLNVLNYSKLSEKILNLEINNESNIDKKITKIPVCCVDDFFLDRIRIEERLKISKEKILNLFFNKSYFCYMTGFVAGMPFLGDTHSSLKLERLETPRVKVPKGSVGITEQFCNIYTFDSPGGWNIIGNTPSKIFDKDNNENPVLVKPGDTIIFENISKVEFEKLNDK